MDAFGIGAAVQGALRIYFQSARCSGRTTALLESLGDGDRIIFLNQETMRSMQTLVRELEAAKGIKVELVVWSDSVQTLGTARGRTIFDHSLVEHLYKSRVQDTEQYIDTLQRRLSGFGRPHLETRIAAREAAKWNM